MSHLGCGARGEGRAGSRDGRGHCMLNVSGVGAEGIVYKVLQADLHTTSDEIVEAALEKANIIDDPKRFYLAITSKNEMSKCLSPSWCVCV